MNKCFIERKKRRRTGTGTNVCAYYEGNENNISFSDAHVKLDVCCQIFVIYFIFWRSKKERTKKMLFDHFYFDN